MANITVPLVGLVDTAVAGHLHSTAGTSAEFIGGISVGALILNVFYWNFAFLRASTGGLTAQAYGRGEGYMPILRRGLKLALGISALLLLLGWPLSRLSLLFRAATPGVAALAAQYILIRIWAAPATLSLMVIKGWFIGMQDTRSAMFADLTVNAVNIAASILLTLGFGNWQGLGFPGIALGTVIAQWSGLLLALLICRRRYGALSRGSGPSAVPGTTALSPKGDTAAFFRLNGDLFIRSLCITGVYLGYTFIASHYGETMLASANIMMNLLLLFSYFTDGFAYAGEALSGRFIGEGNREMLRRSVRGTFAWSFGVAGFWILIYLLAGPAMLGMMTSDEGLIHTCSRFLPWLLVMPPAGCAAFTWDGIYIGATASKWIRNSMILALLSFLGFWFAGMALFQGFAGPSGISSGAAIHLLMAAYFVHLLARTWYLTKCHWSRFCLIGSCSALETDKRTKV